MFVSDFLCFINSHEFTHSIISNIRHECYIAMSLHYYCTNNGTGILEHVVACDMSNCSYTQSGDCEQYSVLHHANVFIVEDSICLHLGVPSDQSGSHKTCARYMSYYPPKILQWQ